MDFGEILMAIDKLQIVLIQLSNSENPQQVFESINSTWVTLKQSDLIRNFVLMNKDDTFQTLVYDNYRKLIEFKYVNTDNLKELPTWHSVKKLLKQFKFIVLERNDDERTFIVRVDLKKTNEMIKEMQKHEIVSFSERKHTLEEYFVKDVESGGKEDEWRKGQENEEK